MGRWDGGCTECLLATAWALSCVACGPRGDGEVDFQTGPEGATAPASTDEPGGAAGTAQGEPSPASGQADDTSGESGVDGPRLDVGAGETEGVEPEQIAEVFANSATALYRVDPETKDFTLVGDFVGCGDASMDDIALDADSQMFGTSANGVYAIDRTTAQCTLIAKGAYPKSLSFVPAGTVDPADEALVGFADQQYVRIDPTTGAQTVLGDLQGGLIGDRDLVSVLDGPTYLNASHVMGELACWENACFTEIDPVTGEPSSSPNFGIDGADGLAYWAGAIYGFTSGGNVVEIQILADGSWGGYHSIPTGDYSVVFTGAASTTVAPPAAG